MRENIHQISYFCILNLFVLDCHPESSQYTIMYIKCMVVDGFKSYAQRTEINGFDPMFNAITGLNGSGKSNILDSICFLLGISNLTQVGTEKLITELLNYKTSTF